MQNLATGLLPSHANNLKDVFVSNCDHTQRPVEQRESFRGKDCETKQSADTHVHLKRTFTLHFTRQQVLKQQWEISQDYKAQPV